MQYFEIFLKCFTAIGVIAAIYNIFSSRTIVQQQQTKEKVEKALALSQENKKDIDHLREKMDIRDDANKESLKKIGDDVAFVRDMFTKWLLDPNRKS